MPGLRVINLGRSNVGGHRIPADYVKVVAGSEQRVPAACVFHRSELRPGSAVQAKEPRAVTAEAVPAGDVDLVIERGGGRVIQAQRQARAGGPCVAIELPDGAEAVASCVKTTDHVQLAARDRRCSLLKRNRQVDLHALGRWWKRRGDPGDRALRR